MMNKLPSLIAVFSTLALAPGARAELAEDHLRGQFRGDTTSAQIDVEGPCGFLSVYAFGTDEYLLGTGQPVRTDYADGLVFGFDRCTGERIVGFAAEEGASEIERLESASASVRLTLLRTRCDANGCVDRESSADLDVAWTGTGDVERNRDVIHQHIYGEHIFVHFAGAFRDADVAASLVEDGVDLIAGGSTEGRLIFAVSGFHDYY